MAVNLSIKDVPDKLVAKLKRRAASNHRSLQGELLTILQQAVEGSAAPGGEKKSVEEVWRELQKIGLRTPDESVQMIREDRDAR